MYYVCVSVPVQGSGLEAVQGLACLKRATNSSYRQGSWLEGICCLNRQMEGLPQTCKLPLEVRIVASAGLPSEASSVCLGGIRLIEKGRLAVGRENHISGQASRDMAAGCESCKSSRGLPFSETMASAALAGMDNWDPQAGSGKICFIQTLAPLKGSNSSCLKNTGLNT